MTEQEKDRIENAIRHIKTAADVDEWAMEIAVEAMEKQIPMKHLNPELGENGRVIYPCGNCGDETGNGDFFPWCGQAIDWGV
jgi:hypothetical protein